MMTPISWLNVSKAISWYESLGYTYVEMPWTASEEAVLATKPLDRLPCCIVEESPQAVREGTGGAKHLIGSAEQGFIDMMLDGRIVPGILGPNLYVAATPCFRSDEVDLLHQKTFFKVELCSISKYDTVREYREVMLDAFDFMASLLPEDEARNLTPVKVSKTQTDLELNGIEVGSYGIRKCTIGGKRLQWTYGTGLAEPRFSIAAKQPEAP